MSTDNTSGGIDDEASISAVLSIGSDIDSFAGDFISANIPNYHTFSYNDLCKMVGHDESKAFLHLQNQLNQYFLSIEKMNTVVIEANLFYSSLGRLDALMEGHWQRLADSLQCRGSDAIHVFSIKRIQLTKNVMGTLLPSLKRTNINTCVFDKNSFLRHAGITFVTELLEENDTLEGLVFICNPIPFDINVATANRLCNILNAHPCLRRLSIIHCELGRRPRFLSSVVSASFSNLHCVCLPSNKLGSPGAALVASLLSDNPPLEMLDLRDNDLTDDDATLFVNVLKRNTNLHKLWMSNNKLTVVGGSKLLRAVFDWTSLNSVSDSNHTCHLRLYEEGDDKMLRRFQHPISCINSFCEITGHSRKTKIVLALVWTPHSTVKVSYLHGLPVKLIPDALRILQVFLPHKDPACNRIQTLDVLYEAVTAISQSYSNGRRTVEIPPKQRCKSKICNHFRRSFPYLAGMIIQFSSS